MRGRKTLGSLHLEVPVVAALPMVCLLEQHLRWCALAARQLEWISSIALHNIWAWVRILELGRGMRCEAIVAVVCDEHERAIAECNCARVLVASQTGVRGGGGGDLDSCAVHVELLLAVVPDPGEEMDARLDVARHLELKVLALWSVAIVAVRTVAFVGRSNAECLAMVGREADLTRATEVVANAMDAPGKHGQYH